jgi:hypothetical protein
MRYVIGIAGYVVIFGVGFVAQIKTSEKRVTEALHALGSTVDARLTAEVEAWLLPQLRRRDLWIGCGAVLGIMAGNIPFLFMPQGLPWYWFAAALGVGAGTILGTVAAGFRTFPKVDSSLRTVRPQGRHVSDYFSRRRLVLMRCSLPIPLVAVALGAGVMAYGSRELGALTIAFCGSAVLVVFCSLWVQHTLVSRPMVSSTIEGLLWLEALLAETVKGLPQLISFIGCFSGVVAVYATVVARDDLPWWVLLTSGLFLLVGLATAAVVGYLYRPGREDTGVPALRSPRESPC